MPHRCTNCEHVFADGSKEMLSGCPDCGGNTFQYLPDDAQSPPEESPPEESPPDRAGTESSVAETVGRAATTLRDAVAGATGDDAPEDFDAEPPDEVDAETPDGDADGSPGVDVDGRPESPANATGSDSAEEDVTPDPFPPEADPRTDAELVDDDSEESGDDPEDFAQSSARTDVVSDEELPGGMAGFGRTSGDPPAADEPRQESGGEPGSGSTPADRNSASMSTDRNAGSQSGATDPGSGGPAPQSDDREPATEGPNPPSDGQVVDTPSDDRPNLDELRQELNEQFEGIRIVERGQYELNLMELYEREETIIALKENGRYVIEPPESWRGES